MTPEELYATEHAQGLHGIYAPPGCPECVQPTQRARPIPPALPPDEPRPATAPPPHSYLGDALHAVTRSFVIDQPDDPEQFAPSSPDGDPYCEACKGVRWVIPDRTSRLPTPAIRCAVCINAPWAVQRRVDRILGHLPAGLRDYRMDTFPTYTPEAQRVTNQCLDWLEAPGDPWLLLYGKVGRGKTGLAVALLYELVTRGWSGAFKITTDLLTTIKSTFGTRENADDPGELDILHALYTVDIFVLDDLGSEYHRNGDDWATEKIFQVIDGRYVERKRMIITSNWNLLELVDRLGHARTASRIYERTRPDWAIDMTQLPSLRMRT